MTAYLQTISALSSVGIAEAAPTTNPADLAAASALRAALATRAHQIYIMEDARRSARDFESALLVARADLANLEADSAKYTAWRLLHHPKRAVSMQEAAEHYNAAANFAALAYTAAKIANDESADLDARIKAAAQAAAYAMYGRESAEKITIDESKQWSLMKRRTATSRRAEVERVRSLDMIAQNNVRARSAMERLQAYELIYYRQSARASIAEAAAEAAGAAALWYQFQLSATTDTKPVDLRFKAYCAQDAAAAAAQAAALPSIAEDNRHEHVFILAMANECAHKARLAAEAAA